MSDKWIHQRETNTKVSHLSVFYKEKKTTKEQYSPTKLLDATVDILSSIVCIQ